jgi:hypothetical protein
LDELKISHLTEEDKKFLEEFTNLELLSMNQTNIKSTANFPDAPNLIRVGSLALQAPRTPEYQAHWCYIVGAK